MDTADNFLSLAIQLSLHAKLERAESRIAMLESKLFAAEQAMRTREETARKAGGTDKWPSWWDAAIAWAHEEDDAHRAAFRSVPFHSTSRMWMGEPGELRLRGYLYEIRPTDFLNIEVFCGRAQLWQDRAEMMARS